jgi:CysZ protein
MILFSQKGNNPFYVTGCLLKGSRFLMKAELRKFLLIPLLINLLLYSSALVLAYFYVDDVLNYLLPSWLKGLAWLSGILIVIKGVIFVVSLVLYFFIFTLLANLIASPFYAKLSENTVILLRKEQNNPSALEDLPNPTWRESLHDEWKKIRYLLLWVILLLVLSVIPVVNLIAPFLWGLWGAWGIGLEYLSYPLGNQGLLFSKQKKLAKSVRFGLLTFGGVTLLGLSVPFINILVSPIAVIAITIYTEGISQQREA